MNLISLLFQLAHKNSSRFNNTIKMFTKNKNKKQLADLFAFSCLASYLSTFHVLK